MGQGHVQVREDPLKELGLVLDGREESTARTRRGVRPRLGQSQGHKPGGEDRGLRDLLLEASGDVTGSRVTRRFPRGYLGNRQALDQGTQEEAYLAPHPTEHQCFDTRVFPCPLHLHDSLA